MPAKKRQESAEKSGWYTYTDGSARTYEDRALLVEPGDTVEWPEGPPDHRWTPTDADAPVETTPED